MPLQAWMKANLAPAIMASDATRLYASLMKPDEHRERYRREMHFSRP
jgi:hypothetical protein